jgi:hypothetical protein
MPVALSYPGVYLEEIPSGVRTITGVATSITAFVGWAPKGPTDYAGLVLSWSDFVRQYGGMDANSYLGYAVSHFFANGGQQAYIVRLVETGNNDATKNAQAATLTLGTSLTLTAQNPGQWANGYGIKIKIRSDDATRFRLQVVYAPKGATSYPVVESFENLSIDKADPQQRFVESVIHDQSSFIKAKVESGATGPPANTNDEGETKKPAQMLGSTAPGQDGEPLWPSTDSTTSGDFEAALNVALDASKGGLYLLEHVDLFNLLCVPGEIVGSTLQSLAAYCGTRRAFLIVDSAKPNGSPDPNARQPNLNTKPPTLAGDAKNAAFYYPWVQAPDPLDQNRSRDFPTCGFVAGLYARTDANRGVWKAPAGIEAGLTGISGVSVPMNDKDNGKLNPTAVNCIRNFNVYGTVIWGARTTDGNDEIGSEWKYIPVRRTALFIEESLFRALKWVVFEPNDEPLWAQIRLNVGAFMHNLFRQGAFQGKTPQEAYFVKCDKETTTQNDINLGIVNIVVGFAPLKPAEFVVIKIQQMAGQIAT